MRDGGAVYVQRRTVGFLDRSSPFPPLSNRYVRGMLEVSRLIGDICDDYCPSLLPLAPALDAAAAGLAADISASLLLSCTFNGTTGAPVFVPPIAALGIAPFGTSE
jgi:hypothetical protein